MRVRILLLISVAMILTDCSGGNNSLNVNSIQTEIGFIDTELLSAEKENEKYSGGLVKALINSRIQTLKQSRAMLKQKQNSWLFGININYTINGRPFVIPEGAKALLPDIERELEESKGKIKAQERVTDQYSGGLTQALSMATLETMRQTHSMLDQRRLAIKYDLPQYLAFQNKGEDK